MYVYGLDAVPWCREAKLFSLGKFSSLTSYFGHSLILLN